MVSSHLGNTCSFNNTKQLGIIILKFCQFLSTLKCSCLKDYSKILLMDTKTSLILKELTQKGKSFASS